MVNQWPSPGIIKKTDYKALASNNEPIVLSLFVDDTSMFSANPSANVVFDQTVNCVSDFGEAAKALGLKLSDKAAIVATNVQEAQKVKSHMAEAHDMHFQVHQSTRDLGITYTASVSKPSNLFKETQYKTKGRISKIKLLLKNLEYPVVILGLSIALFMQSSSLPAIKWQF